MFWAAWIRSKSSANYFPRISASCISRILFRSIAATNPRPRRSSIGKRAFTAFWDRVAWIFRAIFKVLRGRHFKGWAVFDIDAPRPGDGTGSVDDNLKMSVTYLREKLGVKFAPPPATGLFTDG